MTRVVRGHSPVGYISASTNNKPKVFHVVTLLLALTGTIAELIPDEQQGDGEPSLLFDDPTLLNGDENAVDLAATPAPLGFLVDTSSDFLANSWSLGGAALSDVFEFDSCSLFATEEMGLGACTTYYFCSYIDPVSCEALGGSFSQNESCEDYGFSRFLEYYATGEDYDNTPPLQVCIRQSLNAANESFCESMEYSATGSFGEICVEDDLGGSTGEPTNCASQTLTDHVLIPNYDNVDMNACFRLTSRGMGPGLLKAGNGCSVSPPTQCDSGCKRASTVRDFAMLAVGFIPHVGDLVGQILGLMVPEQGMSTDQVIAELVDYVEARIASVHSETLLDVAKIQWSAMYDQARELENLIATNNTSEQAVNERTSRMTSIFYSCDILKHNLNLSRINPMQRLPYIMQIGEACIAFKTAQVYNYEEVYGAPMPPGYLTSYKESLDDMVNFFIDIADEANSAAITWRSDGIGAKAWSGSWPCSLFCNHRYAQTFDNRCYSVFGLDPSKHGESGSGHQCCNDINLNVIAYPATNIYRELVVAAFEDGLLRSFDANLPSLWEYYLSSNMDSGSKPTTVYRVATSPVENFNALTLEPGYRLFSNIEEYRALKTLTNGNVRINKIEISKGAYIIGIRITHTIDGIVRTNTIGTMGNIDAQYDFEANEVISAVNEVKCVTWNDSRTGLLGGTCFMNQIAIKTALVDPTTGAFVADKGTWAPYGLPVTGWLEAPAIAQFNKEAFFPHVIGFAGWWTSKWYYNVEMRVPLWVYQTLD